jgi:NADPH:quinone reductase-like Zn-dependent oxidoreductase
VSAALTFVPNGFDCALLTAGGEKADVVTKCVKNGGRIAYPNGIYPVPTVSDKIKMSGYNGEPDSDLINRFNYYIKTGKIKAHVHETFILDDACAAHIALEKHYLGKLCLKIC